MRCNGWSTKLQTYTQARAEMVDHVFKRRDACLGDEKRLTSGGLYLGIWILSRRLSSTRCSVMFLVPLNMFCQMKMPFQSRCQWNS